MPAISGSGGYVKEGSTAVAEIHEWNATINADLYDSTVFGDSWKESVAGLKGATGSVMGYWMLSDTGQTALQNAILGGTTLTLHLSPNGTNEFAGSAFISQLQEKAPVNGLVEVTFAFTFTGAVTYS